MSEGTSYSVRWRGRRFDRLNLAEMSQRLASGEFSFLHEVLVGNRWVPVRQFFEELAAAEDRRAKEMRELMRQREEEERERAERAPIEPASVVGPPGDMGNIRFEGAIGPETTSAMPHPEESVDVGSMIYGGFWLRFVASWVDSLILSATIGIVTQVFLTIVVSALGSPEFLSASNFGEFADALRDGVGLVAIALALNLILVWIYFAVQESGAVMGTFGKRALGLTVRDLSGARISFGRATGRHFGKYVSVLLFGVGFLMAAFTRRKQALHDIMSECVVVRQ